MLKWSVGREQKSMVPGKGQEVTAGVSMGIGDIFISTVHFHLSLFPPSHTLLLFIKD